MNDSSVLTPARRALIYALSCELAGTPPTLLADFSADELFTLASELGVRAMVASSLMRLGNVTEDMRTALNVSVRRSILFDSEISRVSRALSENEIPHALLKGALLKKLYPSIGLREMSDCDMLFDPSRREDVRDIMSSLGYTVSEYGSGCHDVYLKPPVFNFEMHVSLFSNLESESLTRYFTGALDRAIPGDGAFLCTFTPEDQYLYIKSHEYKHFSIGGTGVRSLLDTYVYLRAQGAAMDPVSIFTGSNA